LRRTHAFHAKFDTSLSGYVPAGFRRDIFDDTGGVGRSQGAWLNPPMF
jgi:hypothetical protein